ncbi:MAG: hypothetical protein JO001_10600 [Alphaproteobacteria bacterium]|nr:hypothetical protein [Alphaproteobacteria bacterium]
MVHERDHTNAAPEARRSRITAHQVGNEIILSIRLENSEAITLAISATAAAELRTALAASAEAYAGLSPAQLLEAPPFSAAADPLTMIRSRPGGGASLRIALPGNPVLIEYSSGALQQLSDVILGLLTTPLM